ncbi:MAG: alpha/beta hydrolase [Bacteroidota bacterium]
MFNLKKRSWRHKFRLVWFLLVTVFMFWQCFGHQAKGITPEMRSSNDQVHVAVTDEMIRFSPSNPTSVEILFFPGGMVDPGSYIPLSRDLAIAGYHVSIIKMPWRLSTNEYLKTKEMFDLNDPTKQYLLAGHSQEAEMAAQFVYEHPDLIDGLILLGTSHPRDFSMADIRIPSLKIYVENDGLASPREVFDNEIHLPEGSEIAKIKGGNHSQFGSMGRLLMDGKSTISRKEQQQKTADLMIEFMTQFEATDYE